MAGLSCGILGLPNVGKSTLFNALTRAEARVENYPFCTIDPNVGVIRVPDERLQRLNRIEQRADEIPAVIEFVDIAGLVEGASKGEGRGNEFLDHVHHVDLLVHVVRTFDDPNVVHVRGSADPLDDIRIINIELILADLQTTTRALERTRKLARGRDRAAARAVTVLEKLEAHLDAEQPARTLNLPDDDWAAVRDCRFLTRKPVLYVPNVGDDCADAMDDDPGVRAITRLAAEEGASVLPVCAQLEAEIAELGPGDEAREFIEAMGLEEDGLARLIRTCYRHLGLITFFTVGEHEVRAWTVTAGATAPEAGARIHTDFQDRFIRVEVVPLDTVEQSGSRQAARDRGLLRTEGRDYIVQDGDILFFRIAQA